MTQWRGPSGSARPASCTTWGHGAHSSPTTPETGRRRGRSQTPICRAAIPHGRWLYLWVHTSIAIADGATDDVTDAALEALYEDERATTTGEPLSTRTLQAVRAEARGSPDATAADAAIKAAEDLPIIYCSFDLSELLAVQSHHGEIQRMASRLPEGSIWRRALMAATEGRAADAADIFKGMGSQALAARMHMLAATTAIKAAAPRKREAHAEARVGVLREGRCVAVRRAGRRPGALNRRRRSPCMPRHLWRAPHDVPSNGLQPRTLSAVGSFVRG